MFAVRRGGSVRTCNERSTPGCRKSLADRREPDRADPDGAVPVLLLYLLKQRTIWGMMIGFFCLNFAIYFFITWFPTFLINARHFSFADVRYYGLFPALFAIPFGWIGGGVSDALLRHGWSATRARKTCLVGGMLVSCVIAFAPIVESSAMALVLMGISYAALAFTAANIWTLPVERLALPQDTRK
ncbi:MFS transporter [Asaia spathodeae]